MPTTQPLENLRTETVPEPTVFVVDDDPVVNDSLRFLLESVGMNVVSFNRVEQFLDEFDAETPGCVILDLQLPDGTGLDALKRLRERNPTIPVIMVTGHARVPKVVSAMRLGAIDFLEKPLDHVGLLNKVRTAVERDIEQWPQLREVSEIRRRISSLTKRETEVLDLVVEGHSSKEVGQLLDVKEKTVEAHRASLSRKIGSGNVSQLVNMVLRARGTAPLAE